MTYEKKPEILKWDFNPGALDSGGSSFELVLDAACERLQEKRIQYSLRRIREMDEELTRLEKELDEFARSEKPASGQPNCG